MLVTQRPGYPLTMETPEQQAWLDENVTDAVETLHQQPAGKVFLAQTPLYDISATTIRHRLENHQSCDDLLPPDVLTFIVQQGLYR